MQHADQGEQAPGGIEIDVDLALKTLFQHVCALIVDGAAGHVHRFNLLGGRRLDGLIVTIANCEIFSDEPTKAAKGT